MTLPGKIQGVFLPWAQAVAAAAPSDSARPNTSAPLDRMERTAPQRKARDARVAYRPLPVVPESDRRPLDREALMRLAIALDVLSMLTQELAAHPEILQRLSEKLADVGRLGGTDDDGLRELVEHAHSAHAAARAVLSQELSAGNDGEPQLATATGVARALRAIEAAARLVVKDATLLLSAHPPEDVWSA